MNTREKKIAYRSFLTACAVAVAQSLHSDTPAPISISEYAAYAGVSYTTARLDLLRCTEAGFLVELKRIKGAGRPQSTFVCNVPSLHYLINYYHAFKLAPDALKERVPQFTKLA